MIGTSKPCVAESATQTPVGIGHNGGPSSEPFGLRARWLRFANALVLRRLAKLQVRIKHRQRGLDDLRHEQDLIRNRCIRRMRRAAGKN